MPPRDEKTPDEVLPGAKVEAFWKCRDRGHVFAQRVDRYTVNPACPTCEAKKRAKARVEKERRYQRQYARDRRARARAAKAAAATELEEPKPEELLELVNDVLGDLESALGMPPANDEWDDAPF